jgi:glycine/D-amino acid oxidase-like deaminating enzyme
VANEDFDRPPTGRPDDASIDRRDFLRVAGMGAGALIASGCAATMPASPVVGIEPTRRRTDEGAGHVVVIGAGAWGSWTAYHLRQRGARVTLIDQYGPANSKATSGDETRGIRSSYGDRTTGEHWCRWARVAIGRWKAFDAEWARAFGTQFFFETGDVIMRAADEPFVKRTREIWAAQGVPHEVLSGDEARKRWPAINADDVTIALTEPDAGVVRSRYATQAVAAVAQRMGARLVISRARLGTIANGRLGGVILDDGTTVRGDAYVFACGAWTGKLFPALLSSRIRTPLGYVCYFATPEGDSRFTAPNLPSWNFPGVTGWPALSADNRGFRVRGALAVPPPPRAAGAAPTTPPPPLDPAQQDPDTSSRWASPERIDGSRRFVARRFPALANAPLLETRACHYEFSVNRDFIIDQLPDAANVWVAGLGQAEGFKFGPVAGEYVAQRVLGNVGDPAIAKMFSIPTEKFEAPSGGAGGAA